MEMSGDGGDQWGWVRMSGDVRDGRMGGEGWGSVGIFRRMQVLHSPS